jgi:hypothetical protein
MRAMILDSVDGQEYARVVLLPESMDILKAEEIAETAINKAVDANPQECTWDEIATELERAGFVIPHTFNGPTWDSRSS